MACSSSDREQTDPVKQQVAAHWDRRAAHFDEDFGHSIRTAAERAASPELLDHARKSSEYAAIADRLPFPGGWPREEIERLFAAHQLVNIASDPFLDLVAAEEQRMQEEGLERRIRRRYAVWGNVPP